LVIHAGLPIQQGFLNSKPDPLGIPILSKRNVL
jgi:hypothetical protein